MQKLLWSSFSMNNKRLMLCVFGFLLIFCVISQARHTETANANMAEPRPDQTSGIVFDKHPYSLRPPDLLVVFD